MTIWGYARCSTNETKQNIERQIRELKEMGCTDQTIFIEWESGSKENRKELNRLLNTIEDFDTVAVVSVDRISRSCKQLISIIELIEQRHLKLIIGKNFVVDCTTDKMDIMTEALLKVISVFSELERKMICSRVQSGVDTARAKGVKLGRPKTTYDKIPQIFFKNLPLYTKGVINKSQFSSITGLAYKTIFKYLSIVNNQQDHKPIL